MIDRYKEAVQGARDCVEKNKDGGVYLPDLLRVIDLQQAEIEKLNVELVGMRGACNSYKMHYDNAKAEIERLKNNNNKLCEYLDKKELELVEIKADISWFREAKISPLSPAIKEFVIGVKSEAIKEFAERFEAYIPNIEGETTMECVKNAIKQTLKEMVGE